MNNLKKKVIQIIRKILKIMSRPDMLVLPGQLAFFFLLAIVPTITLIAYIASLFHVSFDFITNYIIKAFGSETANLILPIMKDISMTPAFLLALIVSFYTASTGASSIIITSNQLYNIKNHNFLRRKIKAIFMTFILILLLVFILLIPAFGNKFISILEYVNPTKAITKTLIFIVRLAQGPTSWVITFFLIKLIYRIAPDARIPSSYTTKGAFVTTIGFTIATAIYSFFVNHFAHYDILYGGLAHFVVLMIWLYIIATIVTLSLAINSEEFHENGKKRQHIKY